MKHTKQLKGLITDHVWENKHDTRAGVAELVLGDGRIIFSIIS